MTEEIVREDAETPPEEPLQTDVSPSGESPSMGTPEEDEIEDGRTFDAAYVRKLRRENADHRRRLREVTEEHEALRADLADRVFREAAHVAGLEASVSLDEARHILGDEVDWSDPEAAQAGAESLAKLRPHFRRRQGSADGGPRGKAGGGEKAKWGDLLRPDPPSRVLGEGID